MSTQIKVLENSFSQRFDLPKIERYCYGEVWNIFLQKLEIFKENTKLIESEKSLQLYYCCDENQSNAFLKGYGDVIKIEF